MLGVDPGLASTGLAAVGSGPEGTTMLWAATVRTPSDLPEALRLRRLYGAVRDAITKHGIRRMAVEKVMWGKNVGSAMSVARATGVVMLAAADAGVPVEEYAPLEVKMAVAGVGNASKEQVRRALGMMHGFDDVPTEPDAADALAVALCHLQQARMRNLIAGAPR